MSVSGYVVGEGERAPATECAEAVLDYVGGATVTHGRLRQHLTDLLDLPGMRAAVMTARPAGVTVRSPEEAAQVLRVAWGSWAVEEAWALGVSARGQHVATWRVGVGSERNCLIAPPLVFRPAVQTPGIVSVVLAHNHPSGDPTPSAQDIEVTRALRDAGSVLQIPLLDHLILTPRQFTSLMAEGCM